MLHDIWNDPVWSKVIGAAFYAIIVGVLPLILGHRRPNSYPLFQLLATRVPASYFIISVFVLLILQVWFPNILLWVCWILAVVSLVVTVIEYRREQSQADLPASAPAEPASATVFDSAAAESFAFRWSLEQRWEDHKPVGEKAAGTFQFEQDKVITITRTNKDGRLVVHIDRYQEGNVHRVDRKASAMANRIVQVEFDAQVTAGSHSLLFVAKKANDPGWVHNANKRLMVESKSWQRYTTHYQVPNTEDFTLFFEDGPVAIAPSTLQIRNLTFRVINR